MDRRAVNACAVYLAVQFVSSALFNLVSVTAVLYYVDDAGLNPLQLVLVGTVLEGAYLLVDLPTGLLADVVSRRACVVAGFLVLGVGFVVAGLFPLFAVILAAQAVLALGFALVAGALEAWTVGEVGTDRVSSVFLRGSQAGQVGTVAGAALSGLLAGVTHNLTFLVGGSLLAALGVTLAAVMGETGFRPAPRTATGVRATVREAAGGAATAAARVWRLTRARPALLTVFAVLALYGVFSEGFDRLAPARLVEEFTVPSWAGVGPAGWLSALAVAAAGVGLLVTEVLRFATRSDRATAVASAFAAVTACLALSVAVFAAASRLSVALLAYCLATAMRNSSAPVVDAWVARQAPDTLRASLLSAGQVCDSVGQLAGGPVVGAVGAAVSLRAALAVSAVVLLPALPLLAGLRRRLAAADAPAWSPGPTETDGGRPAVPAPGDATPKGA